MSEYRRAVAEFENAVSLDGTISLGYIQGMMDLYAEIRYAEKLLGLPPADVHFPVGMLA